MNYKHFYTLMKYIILPIFILHLIGSLVGCQQQNNNDSTDSIDSSTFTFRKYLSLEVLRNQFI